MDYGIRKYASKYVKNFLVKNYLLQLLYSYRSLMSISASWHLRHNDFPYQCRTERVNVLHIPQVRLFIISVLTNRHYHLYR